MLVAALACGTPSGTAGGDDAPRVTALSVENASGVVLDVTLGARATVVMLPSTRICWNPAWRGEPLLVFADGALWATDSVPAGLWAAQLAERRVAWRALSVAPC